MSPKVDLSGMVCILCHSVVIFDEGQWACECYSENDEALAEAMAEVPNQWVDKESIL